MLLAADNKLLIVKLGGLEPLIRQMLSPNVEVQCNAVGCITNLAPHDDNKTKIAKSGALVALTRLARSKDMRVQRNATGALLNMTHSDENRQQLVNAGAIPVLVGLLATGLISAWLGGSPKRAAVLRLVVGGAAAMAVTFGIGALLGTTVG